MKPLRLLLLPAVTSATLIASPTAMPAKPALAAHRPAAWWPASTSRALARAASNRAELGRALRAAAISQREAMSFLLENASQSMASGLASCSGLSVLLASACRSVAIPARSARVPF